EQCGGAPARAAQGGVRARSAITVPFFVLAGLDPAIHVFPSRHAQDVDARHKAGHGESPRARRRREDYFLPSPPNFFWKRERRPPRSSRCCWPPVQAGCDFGSISSCSLSPCLPQVERVVNSVPSVMTTLTV